MADEHGGYKISDRLLRLSTPRVVKKADGSSEEGLSSTLGSTRSSSPSRKLTPEQMEAIANRLIAQQRKTKELPPLVKSRRLEKHEEEKSVNRLYNEAMATQSKKRAMSAERVFKAERCETKVVPHDQIEELVSRLHDRSAEVAKRKQEVLEKKYNASSHSAASSHGSFKRLGKTEEAEISRRLSSESAEAARSNKASLYEKYVLAKLPKGAPMSPEELAEAANRLYRNEPRTD